MTSPKTGVLSATLLTCGLVLAQATGGTGGASGTGGTTSGPASGSPTAPSSGSQSGIGSGDTKMSPSISSGAAGMQGHPGAESGRPDPKKTYEPGDR